MVALILVPFLVLTAVDNDDFLARVTDAEWRFVGIQHRQSGIQDDGSVALPLQTDGKSYILFKQRSLPSVARDIADAQK